MYMSPLTGLRLPNAICLLPTVPVQFPPSLQVRRGLRVLFVPAGLLLRVGEREEGAADGADDARHVGEVDLLPLVADRVVVGELEGDARAVRRHARVRERLVVAAREVGVRLRR